MSYPRSLGRTGHGHLVAALTEDCGRAHGHLVAQTYINTYILFPLAALSAVVENAEPTLSRQGGETGRVRHRSLCHPIASCRAVAGSTSVFPIRPHPPLTGKQKPLCSAMLRPLAPGEPSFHLCPTSMIAARSPQLGHPSGRRSWSGRTAHQEENEPMEGLDQMHCEH
jgi:hypothetical protein